MDSSTLQKYFCLGDNVEITSNLTSSVGTIVDFSDSALVLEDSLGNPIVVSIDNIVSCRRSNTSCHFQEQSEVSIKETGYEKKLINDAVSYLDKIYEICSIKNEDVITTNAVVTKLMPKGVVALMDDGVTLTCVKSSFVGYSRENAAIGKRVFCSQNKNDMSYSSLTEMTYSELRERFIRALNTKPIPRYTIVGSILFYMTKKFGSSILAEKKNIKQILRKLVGNVGEEEVSSSLQTASTKIKLADLTSDQRDSIYDLLCDHFSEFAPMASNEQIKYADSLIGDNLGFRIRRVGVKAIVSDIIQNSGNKPSIDNNPVSVEEAIQTKIEEDPFISATCEIKKYYPQHKNGTASDESFAEIRFKDDVIIGQELKDELSHFKFWDKAIMPIPAICVYKKVGKWPTALFITKPGSLSEMRTRISNLRTEGNKDLADCLNNFLENKGYVDQEYLQTNLSVKSEDLLNTTRRQRLIKNFEEAEKGFLEIIRRKYSLDSVVRDLAMMYSEWEKIPKAIELLEKHLGELKDKMKVYNMLFTFYHTTGHDAEAIRVMKLALDLYPADNKANDKQRSKIEHKIDFIKKKKKKAHFSTEDIPAPLLRYDANNTTGEVLAYITDKSFEEKLQFLNQRIGELKNSPELPSYYLAKVQLLEDNGESGTSKQIRNLLADYCKSKARNFFNEDNIISAREYLLQGISICEREDLYFLLYLSLCVSSQEILAVYNNPINSYVEISSKYALVENDDAFYVIFRILKEDTSMSRKLLHVLYEGDACSWIYDELESEPMQPNDFIVFISNIANQYSVNLCSFEKEVDSLLLTANGSDFSHSLLNMKKLSPKETNSFDLSCFSEILEVANYILDCEKMQDYEECEEICRNAVAKIDSTTNAIQKTPTRISTLCLTPILLKQKDLLEKLLNKKYTETLPHICVEAIDDARPIGDEIEIQISVSNEIGFSRANNCILTLNTINGKDASQLSLCNQFDTILTGGNKLNCSFTIKSTFIGNDNISIDYTFTYVDVRKIIRYKKDIINLSVNQGVDYEDFENPYIAHVKSNAVKDASMFKGRDEIINTICKYVLEDYKGYVLYGQKRSGKSSVLYHITQRLRSEHKAFAVEYTMGNSIVQDSESENDSMANLFYTITSEIGRAIKEVDRTVYKESGCHIIRRQEFEAYPDKTFREYLDFYRDIIVDKLNYEQDKIVLIVDEFTYLYYHILEGKISPRIMEFWKGLVESQIFSFVFAGQDAMPRFMDDYQNVFASMHPQELTYIDENSARELIEEPIWDSKNNCSRFHPDAVNEIIKLTACSPFYIMILCSELVKYARQRKRLPIQASDVNALVKKMICNESSISRKDFDNLISCGESRLDIIDKEDSLKVLKDIAIKSRNIDFYDINEITVYEKGKVKDIIDDLLRRGVLEHHSEFGNKVRIKVELFKRWLLNHE